MNKLNGKLLASDTDSVTYQVRNEICNADQINQEVDDINREIALALKTNHMVVAIEEVLIPSNPNVKSFINFSKKSYMFTYAK